jgi:NADH:ubiquinone oxidoreductase subunit 5 (subunit L)/multisubunit Na+/H+ antiporter MnhA subunit
LMMTPLQDKLYLIGVVVSSLSTVIIAVAWLFGYPIGRLIVSDKVKDRSLSPSTHPVVIHFIHLASGVILGNFFLNFIVAMAVYHDHGENEAAISLMITVNLILTVGMYIPIYFYGIYLDTNIEKIIAKYDKEFNKERMNNKEYYQNREMEQLELEVVNHYYAV